MDTTNYSNKDCVPVSDRCFMLGLTPDGKNLYFAGYDSDKLSVFDLENNQVIKTIQASGIVNIGANIPIVPKPPTPTPPTPTPSTLSTPANNGSNNNLDNFSDGLSVYGRSKRNDFLSERDVFNEIHWSLSSNKVPTHYKIFRDGVLIATVPAEKKQVFEDHDLKSGRTYDYVVVAEDESGFIANGGYAIKAKK